MTCDFVKRLEPKCVTQLTFNYLPRVFIL